MSYTFGVALVLCMFVGMLVLLELGRRLARRQARTAEEADKVGIAAIDGAVFGLLGLLLAFTFAGAIGRWDTRRDEIRAEVNAIGTAYTRLDLLPGRLQPALRQAFREYVDIRMATYSNFADADVLRMNRAAADAKRAEIWRGTIAACRETPSDVTPVLVLPSLNEMFDSATTRDLTALSHTPPVIYVVLAIVVLASALLAGYGMAESTRASRVHMACYALMVTLTVYVTLEIEFPRVGFVRIDAYDAAFVDLREGMK